MRKAQAAVLCTVLVFGCTGRQGTEQQGGAQGNTTVTREFSGGGVTLLMHLPAAPVSLADQVELVLELVVEGGFEAEFPEYLPEDFEGFAVVDVRGPDGVTGPHAEQKPPGNTPEAAVGRRTFVLEPERSGALTIAPLEVFFRESGQKEWKSFETEEVTVQVEPLRDLGALDLSFRDIFQEAPREEGTLRWWYFAAALVLLGCCAGAGLYYMRAKGRPPPPPPPADEVAWEALRRLVALDLIGKGQVEQFYVYLSSIVRTYIEQRFGVRAPELTTEEFLHAASRSPELGPHHRRLEEFLSLCDQVKFARFEPPPAVIQGSFNVAKQFVAETTPA